MTIKCFKVVVLFPAISVTHTLYVFLTLRTLPPHTLHVLNLPPGLQKGALRF